jgi:hypothetical protein
MSGYSKFTSWIDSKAKYLFDKKGRKCKIESTFFTSSPVPNSDEFNVKTDRGVLDWDDIDFEELRERFEKNVK